MDFPLFDPSTVKVSTIPYDYDKLESVINDYLQTITIPDEEKELKNLKKEINNKFKEMFEFGKKLEAKITKPVKEFRSDVKKLTELSDDVMNKIENKLKQFEQDRIDEKQDIIENLQGYAEYHIYFDDNPKWMNVTYKIEDVQGDIKHALEKLQSEFNTIESKANGYVDKTKYLKARKTKSFEEVIDLLENDIELLYSNDYTPHTGHGSEKIYKVTLVARGSKGKLKSLREYAEKIGVDLKQVKS